MIGVLMVAVPFGAGFSMGMLFGWWSDDRWDREANP